MGEDVKVILSISISLFDNPSETICKLEKMGILRNVEREKRQELRRLLEELRCRK